MKKIANNTSKWALLGDFNKAVGEAIINSSEAQKNQMMQLLPNPRKVTTFARLVFDLLKV